MKCTAMKMPACTVKNAASASGAAGLLEPSNLMSPSASRGMVAMRTMVQNAITAVSSQ